MEYEEVQTNCDHDNENSDPQVKWGIQNYCDEWIKLFSLTVAHLFLIHLLELSETLQQVLSHANHQNFCFIICLRQIINIQDSISYHSLLVLWARLTDLRAWEGWERDRGEDKLLQQLWSLEKRTRNSFWYIFEGFNNFKTTTFTQYYLHLKNAVRD